MATYELRQVRDERLAGVTFGMGKEPVGGRSPVPTEAERNRLIMEQMRAATAPVVPTGPSMSMEDARAALAEAITARYEAEAPLRAALDAVHRVEGQLEKCQDEIAQFGRIDQETRQHHEEAMRAWATSAADEPAPSLDPPPDPSQRAYALSLLESKRQAIQRVLVDLRASVAKAEKEAEPARVAARRAAANVLAVETEIDAVRLHEIESEARMLRSKLVPRNVFEIPGVLGQTGTQELLSLSAGARRLLERSPANVWTNDGRDPAAQRAVQAKLDALLSDPDASLD